MNDPNDNARWIQDLLRITQEALDSPSSAEPGMAIWRAWVSQLSAEHWAHLLQCDPKLVEAGPGRDRTKRLAHGLLTGEPCSDLLEQLAQSPTPTGTPPPGEGVQLSHDTETTTPRPTFGGLARVGPYVLGELIGEGAHGKVYEAHEPGASPTTALAIKVLRADEAQERVEREIRTLQRVRSPFVVRLLDTGDAEFEGQRLRYLVFQRAPQGSLREHLRQLEDTNGHLVNERLRLAQRVLLDGCRGLAAIHETGLAHFDVKPENLFLDFGRVLVGDLGTAKGEPGVAQSHASVASANGPLRGTEEYAAPEQLKGSPKPGRSADLFALALVVVEVLNKHPFRQQGSHSTMSWILTEPLPQDTFPPGVPPWLEAILRGLLEKDPRARPHQSASQLLESVQSALHSERTERRVECWTRVRDLLDLPKLARSNRGKLTETLEQAFHTQLPFCAPWLLRERVERVCEHERHWFELLDRLQGGAESSQDLAEEVSRHERASRIVWAETPSELSTEASLRHELPEVFEPTYRLAGSQAHLAWGWPAGVNEVRIAVRHDAFPSGSEDPHIQFDATITRDHYDRHGHYRLKASSQQPHYLRICTRSPDSGRFSPGKTLLLPFQTEVTIYYRTLVKRRWWRGPVQQVWVEFKSPTNPLEVPDLQILAREGRRPLTPEEGDLLTDVPGFTLTGGSTRIQVPLERCSPRRFATVFLKDPSTASTIRLLPSHPDQLRLG